MADSPCRNETVIIQYLKRKDISYLIILNKDRYKDWLQNSLSLFYFTTNRISDNLLLILIVNFLSNFRWIANNIPPPPFGGLRFLRLLCDESRRRNSQERNSTDSKQSSNIGAVFFSGKFARRRKSPSYLLRYLWGHADSFRLD